ncbi:MAG: glycosyltransferase [Candidatus Leucobacter sulfamidivorax]|nr:glycosyltransferase [Candidatus Leucobacter sulfamidivorax]
MDPAPLSIAFVVLHTSPLDEPGTKDAGGMNVVVRAHAEQLARQGHRVRLITRRSSPEQPASTELAPNLAVRHLDAGPARLLAKGEHERLIEPFGRALAAHLARHPADVLHAEHWYSGLAALPVARDLGVPLVQSYHSIAAPDDTPLSAGERPEAPGRLEGERLLAREADLVVAVSEAERATVLERLGASPERVRVVPPGVDTELFRPCIDEECAEREAWIAHGGLPEVLVAGRLHPLKGFDLAVAALAAIPAERRPALRIVGAPPPDGDDYARALHEAVADAGMLRSVSFDGALRRTELAERVRQASLVLIPSHSETFGLVALEAAASGVPVVARAAGGLREAVVDGVTGLLVEGDDPAVWAAAAAGVLGDAELAGRMGRAGRESALARNWEASTAALLETYRELLG